MTSLPIAAAKAPVTRSSSSPTRRDAARRIAAAAAAAIVFSIGGGIGPLVATAGAQSSALEQSLGGSPSSGGGLQQVQAKPSKGGANLNAAPDFSGPGLNKGASLIGWAKAGALIIGVLTLTIGIPVSKALKEAGNHHASGIRTGAIGVGGAILLAGVAGTALPWLMA